MIKFHSEFAKRLEAYVRLRQGLGLKFTKQIKILRAFDQFLQTRAYQHMLTEALVLEFATASSPGAKAYNAQRYQVVRHFTDYMAAYQPDAPQLDPKKLIRPKTRHAIRIPTDEELSRLMTEGERISTCNPMRNLSLHTIIGLVASTGLRIGEIVRLDKSDVDLERGQLLVRKTKFGKDRIVPVHPSTRRNLQYYAHVRDEVFRGCESPAFFISTKERRFTIGGLGRDFLELRHRSGLEGSGYAGMGFHSLRHKFAVTRLATWYKEDKDPQAMLPLLATYMGHAHYTDTAHYLSATVELLGVAAARFHAGFQEKECRP